jgi:hypothetical protein
MSQSLERVDNFDYDEGAVPPPVAKFLGIRLDELQEEDHRMILQEFVQMLKNFRCGSAPPPTPCVHSPCHFSRSWQLDIPCKKTRFTEILVL